MDEGETLKPTRMRLCTKCEKSVDELTLSQTEYRCPTCAAELAHLDVAPNGTIRGVFGYLRACGEHIHERYRVERVLGKGGFGATYLVEDLRLKGRRRALKEVPELLFDEQEVNLLSQLHHPSIPDIIDRFVSDGMIYLVLEFGGTRTLGSECERLGGRVPLAILLPWMQQLCEALTYLHSQKPAIIHRDLKPENVLLDDTDRIKLIDFGIAKEADPAMETRVLARAASHGFSSPEQVLGTGTDERSDIYSLGATFYYLLTGKLIPAAHERLAGKEVIALSSMVPDLPLEVDRIFTDSINLNINKRPGRVEELKYVLDILGSSMSAEHTDTTRTVRLDPDAAAVLSRRDTSMGMQGIRIDTASPIPLKSNYAKTTSRRGPRLAVGLALLMLLVLATGAYFFFFKTEKTTVKKDLAPPTSLPPSASPAAPQKHEELPLQGKTVDVDSQRTRDKASIAPQITAPSQAGVLSPGPAQETSISSTSPSPMVDPSRPVSEPSQKYLPSPQAPGPTVTPEQDSKQVLPVAPVGRSEPAQVSRPSPPSGSSVMDPNRKTRNRARQQLPPGAAKSPSRSRQVEGAREATDQSKGKEPQFQMRINSSRKTD